MDYFRCFAGCFICLLSLIGLIFLIVELKLSRNLKSIKKEIAEMKKQIEGMDKHEYVYAYSKSFFAFSMSPLFEKIHYQTLFKLILKKLNVDIKKEVKDEKFILVDRTTQPGIKHSGKPLYNKNKK